MTSHVKHQFLLLLLLPLSACLSDSKPAGKERFSPNELTETERDGKTEITVLGLIHGAHRQSPNFPLSRIKAVVSDIRPDIILTEIPADRIDAAISSFEKTGKVTEARTLAFPEYTDVIIPLQRENGYRLVGTAAWAPHIAAKRREVLSDIGKDPKRAGEWQAWQDAQASFRKTLNGRGDDPAYIHSPAYDRAVEARYQPHIKYFDQDIGAGGWLPINQAHWANISAELDAISGKGQRVLITYGGFHKYLILRELKQRNDVIITPALRYFNDGASQ